MHPPFFSFSHTITPMDMWRWFFYASSLLMVLLVAVFWLARVAALDSHLIFSQQQLQLYATHVEGMLSKYETMPALLAINQRVIKVLNQPNNHSARQALNELFERSAITSQALDIYLMDRQGMTLAASNWRGEEKSFIGQDFSYRPYFQQALQGRTGRYFAIGTTSEVRGYYFADPVYQLGKIIGAVVVKLDVSLLEHRWQGAQQEVLLTDPNGIVFIATDPSWLYHSLSPLSDQAVDQVRTAKRYLDQPILPLLWQTTGPFESAQWVSVGKHSQVRDFLHLQYPMPQAGWLLHVLSPLDTVNDQVFNVLLITVAVFGIVLLATAMAWQRQQFHRRAQRALQQAHNELEQRVLTRTADLQHQIEERQRAESALHAAQDKLVQTAKLAMLGQLSASVTHELNQPLAAIRSYAGNAQLLLQRDRTTDVATNLTEITQLVDRMARISAQLKQFARKSSGECVAVSLAVAVDVSLQLWRRELRQSGIQILLDPTMDSIQVLADATRLEQVLVNLIGNAFQALVAAATPKPVIQLNTVLHDGLCRITVSDNGPGIPDHQLSQIFDPFFTTRQAGLGLGLAISQQIIDSFDGTLVAAAAPQGGAAFSFSLRCA